MVYGTLRTRGLIHNPWQTQTIQRCLSILRHSNRDNPSRDLHDENMELVQTHVGSSVNFWELPFQQYGMLAPKGCMGHVWESLDDTPLTLRGHDLTFPTRRLGDCHLMDCFIEAGYNQDTILVLQDCRLYLQAVTLSDICTADALCIAP